MSAPTTVAALLASCALATTSLAQITGGGTHLPLPAITGVSSGYIPYTVGNITATPTFDGTWTSPVQAPWLGTFTAQGLVPASGSLANTMYDFTTLAAGHLPAGTSFSFGDLDNFGSNERFILRAFDPSGAIISTPWLDWPGWVVGTGSGTSGAPALIDMPGWSWSASRYVFDGMSVSPAPFVNPAITFELLSLVPISSLHVEKWDALNGFHLRAPPVPAPGALAPLGLAGLLALRQRR